MIEPQRQRILDEDKANDSGLNNPIMASATPRNLEQTLLSCAVLPLFDTHYLLSPVFKLQPVKTMWGPLIIGMGDVGLLL